jgi:small subunit ribosomal protein S26e
MTVKRRSHGRNKKGRGHVNRVRCASTGKAIPKDKAIKRGAASRTDRERGCDARARRGPRRRPPSPREREARGAPENPSVTPAPVRRRFIVRNIVDASSMRDIRDASAYETYALPKIYIKQYYCIEAAVHQRIVRSRSRTDRRNRDPPPRFQRR